ncbi:helix-turn-helix transcriptional regulator [Cryptosporangium japonicum]|uniref:LuxR family transcriptional regulator n=1 Tax=Cryptosporangium japonicum TaxID=80872 RepID=A0ABN0TI46_9ACTN
MTGAAVRASLLTSGREEALAALDHALADLRAGRGGAVVLEGPPGSGLTTLLRVVDQAAVAADLPRIHAGDGRPLSLYRLARLRRRAAPFSEPYDAVIVLVDDVGHCDASTRRAAELAPPSLGDTALLWVVAGDPAEPSIRAHPVGRRFRIDELSHRDAETLAVRVGGRAPSGASPRFPRHVVETARRADPDGPGWPECLRTGLRAEDHDVLAAAAVLGLRFSPDDLAEVLDRPVGAILDTLLAAVDAGVLVDDGHDLRFSHRVVRRMFPAAGVDVSRVLTTLARSGEVSRLVRVLREQPVPPLAPAVLRDLSNLVARRDLGTAALLAHREAATARSRPDIDEATARFLSYSVQGGDPGTAESSAARLDEDHPPSVSSALAEVFFSSRTAAARNLTDRALSRPTSAVEQARLRAVRLVCDAYQNVFDRTEIDTVAALATDSDDARAFALVGLARTLSVSSSGDLVEALRQASLASEIPDDRSHGPEWWIGSIFRAKLLADLGRLDEAVHVLDACAEEAERRSHLFAIPPLLMVRATCEMEAGRLTDAAANLRAARQLGRTVGPSDRIETNTVNLLVRIAHLRGDASGLAELRPVLEHRLGTDSARRTTAAIGLLVAVEATSADEVADWARLAEGLDGHSRYAIARGITDEILRLRILVRHGLTTHATRLSAFLRALASTTDAPLPNAAALHADGAIARRAETLRAAREAYRELGRPMLSAQASEDLADVSADPVERADALREARAQWFACGAHRETARIDKLLRSSGLRATGAAEPTLGLGLTVSEERVVREVVAGRTNRAIADALFLSPHTVAVHLRRIYAKTGVHNRAGLVELVTGRE